LARAAAIAHVAHLLLEFGEIRAAEPARHVRDPGVGPRLHERCELVELRVVTVTVIAAL